MPLFRRIHPRWPVFRIGHLEAREILYTPGHLATVSARAADLLESEWLLGRMPETEAPRAVAAWLVERAQESTAFWEQRFQAPFAPECLSLSPGDKCNLRCMYCYSRGRREASGAGAASRQADAAERSHRAAAPLVAPHCAPKGVPFHLGTQGGGGPAQHWDTVCRAVAATREAAAAAGVAWRGYLATNGTLSAEQAAWAATNFDCIGLSCDGPPHIHDRLRPFADGSPSSFRVIETAQTIRAAGGNLEARATIIPATMDCQTEIASFLRDELGATRLRFEPVYRPFVESEPVFLPDQAETFAANFLGAQRLMRLSGVTLELSGVRLGEIHGPFCDVLRHTLRLVPGGLATACFRCSGDAEVQSHGLVVGQLDPESDRYILDTSRIEVLQRAASRIPNFCQQCPNLFHCTRGCPDRCPAVGENPAQAAAQDESLAASFRCRLYQLLIASWLLDSVDTTAFKAADPGDQPAHPAAEGAAADALGAFLVDAPPEVDVFAIRRQWQAANQRYPVSGRRMPDPPWREHSYEFDGRRTWELLVETIPALEPIRPMSVYIHVPFCEERCGFCDCYSLPVRHVRSSLMDAYVSALREETAAWAKIPSLSRRPVTTVHWGGGTPNVLTSESFLTVLHDLRGAFNTSPGTEWALESTSRRLTDGHLAWLCEQGFSRLHIGVQTLEEPLRRRIGRRDDTATVLERIDRVLRSGFIATVDIVYGLPGQTVRGLLDTLRRLTASGVHGFSLYRLNRSVRNRRFLATLGSCQPDATADFVLMQAADQFLRAAGFRRNHFDHYCRPPDRNLYNTHATRGEDLLALGATADGLFHDLVYRHPTTGKYLTPDRRGVPVLEGGLCLSSRERAVYPAKAALMAGRVPVEYVRSLGASDLLDRWQECALIESDPDTGGLTLTAAGAWLVQNMIEDLAGRSPA